jgi:hypothetical protein
MTASSTFSLGAEDDLLKEGRSVTDILLPSDV